MIDMAWPWYESPVEWESSYVCEQWNYDVYKQGDFLNEIIFDGVPYELISVYFGSNSTFV